MTKKTHENLQKYIFAIKEENSLMERNYLSIHQITNSPAFRNRNRPIKKDTREK